jgi:hypothetical protein
MLFKRKPRDEPEPVDRAPLSAVDEAYAALHTELGLHHLWYLELRLKEELARAARTDGVFSIAAWRPRLLPGEPMPPQLIVQAGQIISKSLRSSDVAARLDENRLVGLLLDARFEDSTTVAFRIKADLQVRISGAGKWQAGVATFGRDGVDGDGLIQAVLRRLEEDARG